jgi:hypothetical protein
MSKKTISLIIIIVSVLLIIISLTADLIGIGSYPGINYAQLIGAGIGLAGLVFGIWLNRKKEETRN